jgi:NIL domain
MASISPHYRLESIRLKEPDSLIQSQVRIRIPKTCHADPVISNLINRYGLKVNILGALLSPNGQEDGWFDLALHGKASLFYEALLDLVDLNADLWLDIESDDLKRFAMASSSLEYGLESIRLKDPNSLIQTHVRVRIPKTCHPDPIVSNLINRYGLKVNILGALLSPNGQEDGWFDLELHGKAALLYEALLDLVELEADLWFQAEADTGN